jgi:hypothetical protein
MPTVFLLDNSLSMCKYENESDKNSTEKLTTKRELSHSVIKRIVQHISKTDIYEYFALVAYSSTSQVVCEFTRDQAKFCESLDGVKIGDVGYLDVGLNAVSDLVIEEWACFTNIQVLLITDNVDNLRSNSVKTLYSKLKENKVILGDYFLSNGVDFDEKIHFSSILNEDLLKSNFYTSLNKRNYFQCKFPFSFPNRYDDYITF